jgi:hypothetical protein
MGLRWQERIQSECANKNGGPSSPSTCLVLNSVIPRIEADLKTTFHTVRSVFQEGTAAFDGAGIKMKSHIQIAVRHPQAILGYFNPQNESLIIPTHED